MRFPLSGLYYYSAGIQVAHYAEQLGDERGYFRKLALFERYCLFVLINEAFGKNLFLIIILTVLIVLLKDVSGKAQR